MPRPSLRSLSVLAGLLLLAPSLAAADDDSWVDQKIMLRRPGIALAVTRRGERIEVATLGQSIYTVLKDNSDWLRIRQDGKEGWIEKADAVLLDKAIAYFSQRIEADPNDDFALASRACARTEKEEYAQALTDLDAALRLAPKTGWYHRFRGNVFADQKDYDRALTEYSEALRLDPRDISALQHRAVAYHRKCDIDHARADTEESIRLAPNDAYGYALRGGVYVLEEKYDRAIAELNAAIRLDPKDANAFTYRGLCHFKKGEYDQAIADATEAIGIDEKDADAYKLRGAALLFTNDVMYHTCRAIADFDDAIRLKPKEADYFDLRGTAHLVSRDFDSALADFNEALRLDPRHAVARLHRGHVYAEIKDYDRAIADFEYVLQLDGKNEAALAGLGTAYANKLDFDRAVANFDHALRIEPGNTEVLKKRAAVFLAKKEFDQALADLSQVTRLDPNDAKALWLRGVIYLEQKHDRAHAVADLNEAIRLEPNNAAALDARGAVRLAEEDYDRALLDLNEALRIDPEYASAFFHRGATCLFMLDLEHAIADLSESIRLEPAAGSYRYRTLAYVLNLDFEHARADLAEAIRLEPHGWMKITIDDSDAANGESFCRTIIDYLVELFMPCPAARKPADPTDIIPTADRWTRVRVEGTVIDGEEVRMGCFQSLMHPMFANLSGKDREEELRPILGAAWQDAIDRELVLRDLETRMSSRPDYIAAVKKVGADAWAEHEAQIKSNLAKYGLKMDLKEYLTPGDDTLRKVGAEAFAEIGPRMDPKDLLAMQDARLAAYRRHIERRAMMMEYLRAQIYPIIKAEVTPAKIEEYYRGHREEYQTPDTIAWQDVFIDASKFADRAAARKHAVAVQARALRGEAFLDLVKRFDQGDACWRQGLGVGEHRGEISPPELEPVLFQLDADQVGPVVPLVNGFHIVKVLLRVHDGCMPLDGGLKEEIRKKLSNDVANREQKRILHELRRKATIVVEGARQE